MNRNYLLEDSLNDSPSEKKVTFCSESSLLYYSTEGTVDSLNDSAIQTIQNDDLPLSPQTSSMFENSFKNTKVNDNYISKQGLHNLPEAMVILQRLPETLIYAHTNNDSECQMPNTAKTCILDSSHPKKNAEPVVNQSRISTVSKKNKYPLRNLNLSVAHISDKYKNCVSERKISEISCIAQSHSQNFNNEAKASKLKVVYNVKAKSKKLCAKNSVLQKKSSDTKTNSFFKEIAPKSVLSTGSESFKYVCKNNTKENVCKESAKSIASAHNSTRKNCGEVSFDKYPCVHLEKLNLEQYLENISKFSNSLQNNQVLPMDLELEVGNTTTVLNDLSMSEKSTTVNEEKSVENKHSSPCKNAQISFPFIRLKKLTLAESDKNYSINFQESAHTDLVPTNVPCLRVQKRNVCSISRKKSTKVQNQTTENEVNIMKPKLIQASSFNVAESSSNNTTCDKAISDSSSNSLSSEDDIPLALFSKQKLINAHSFHYSEDSSSDEIPLINFSKANAHLSMKNKVKNSHKHTKEISIHGNVPVASLVKTKAKISHAESHKHKKKNSVHFNSKSSLTLKNRSPNFQATKNKKIAELSLKKKKNKKSLKKKQEKMYKMLMKYLKNEMKSKNQKKKENSKKSESGMSIPSHNSSDSESDDSISKLHESVQKQQSSYTNSNYFQTDKASAQCKKDSHGESSSNLKKGSKTKKEKKLLDKYRLGFLSNKFSLRFYNRFLASERLLLSETKMKKHKKKELKRLCNRLKTVGLLSYK